MKKKFSNQILIYKNMLISQLYMKNKINIKIKIDKLNKNSRSI